MQGVAERQGGWEIGGRGAWQGRQAGAKSAGWCGRRAARAAQSHTAAQSASRSGRASAALGAYLEHLLRHSCELIGNNALDAAIGVHPWKVRPLPAPEKGARRQMCLTRRALAPHRWRAGKTRVSIRGVFHALYVPGCAFRVPVSRHE
jgi:hypothetical protein